MIPIDSANIAAELERVSEHWSPRVIGRVGDNYVKVAKLLGEFVWHSHDEEDELFLIVSERLRIQLEGDREVVLDPGEFYVVPKGVHHNPIADEEVSIVLIEPVTTTHTGSAVSDRTVSVERQLAG